MNIYLASSHRNLYWDSVKAQLESYGAKVFDWKAGFHYGDMLPDVDHVSVETMRQWVREPSISSQLVGDLSGIAHADVVVLVLPAGNDAHTECGLAFAMGIPVFVLAPEGEMRASLFYGMYRGIFGDVDELARRLVLDVEAADAR